MHHLGTVVFVYSAVAFLICTSVYSAIFSKQWNFGSSNNCLVCGIANHIDHGRKKRVIDGHSVKPWNKYPWLVLIQTRDPELYTRYTCVGCLISSSYVLTAAHCFLNKVKASSSPCNGDNRATNSSQCFYQPDQIRVFGLQQNGVRPNIYPDSGIEVKRVVPHPTYRNREDSENDISLLELKNPIVCGPRAAPVCLPSVDFQIPEVITAGWGRDDPQFGFRESVPLLKEGILDVVPPTNCKIRATDKRVPETLFCTTGMKTRQSPCMGDSGAPLVTQWSGVYFTLGIFAGVEHTNCNPDDPISGTKVWPYVKWIRETVCDLPQPPPPAFQKAVKLQDCS